MVRVRFIYYNSLLYYFKTPSELINEMEQKQQTISKAVIVISGLHARLFAFSPTVFPYLHTVATCCRFFAPDPKEQPICNMSFSPLKKKNHLTRMLNYWGSPRFTSIPTPKQVQLPGGRDCFSFSAFSLSVMTKVQRQRLQRTLNFTLSLFFLILTAIVQAHQR